MSIFHKHTPEIQVVVVQQCTAMNLSGICLWNFQVVSMSAADPEIQADHQAEWPKTTTRMYRNVISWPYFWRSDLTFDDFQWFSWFFMPFGQFVNWTSWTCHFCFMFPGKAIATVKVGWRLSNYTAFNGTAARKNWWNDKLFLATASWCERSGRSFSFPKKADLVPSVDSLRLCSSCFHPMGRPSPVVCQRRRTSWQENTISDVWGVLLIIQCSRQMMVQIQWHNGTIKWILYY